MSSTRAIGCGISQPRKKYVAKPAAQTFGKYQILERIATGGMAEIYKARLEGIGGFQRTFAIKRILPHLSANREYIAMLVDEAKIAGLLSHANIVQTYDLGQVEGVWYIAMEYVEGRDLGSVLRRARERGLVLPVPHAAFVTIELLKGLEYAHQRQMMKGGRAQPLNIIHRDVSPPNVLLSFQGEVKLTDFGIARASHKALETQSGIIKGRFDYMSPEQAAGAKDLDQRSDLFSVGVLLYEMLTSEHPFREPTELGTLERIRVGRYTPVSTKNADVPFALETIVDRALRPDRNERFPTATAFKEALDKFFQDSGFIFTQSTLSGYVKGLFPETQKGGPTGSAVGGPSVAPSPPRREPARDPRRRHEPDDVQLEDEPDQPTRAIDARVPDEERPTSAGGAEVSLAPASEDQTLIRPVSGFSPAGAGELPTLIGEAPRGAGWSEEQVTLVRPVPSSGSPPPSRDAPSQGAARARPPEPRRGFGVLTFVLVAVSFAFGLLMGVVAAVFVLQLLGPAVLGTAGPAAGPARLHVVAPAGAHITIDGEAYRGEVDVRPDVSHTVQISSPGKPPVSREVKVPPGESRTVVFQVEAAP